MSSSVKNLPACIFKLLIDLAPSLEELILTGASFLSSFISPEKVGPEISIALILFPNLVLILSTIVSLIKSDS